MQIIYLIITMVDHKQNISSHVVAQWFDGSQWNKP